MLFHEIYGCYYNVVEAVLSEALDGTLDKKKIRKIVQEKAFDDSILNIPDKLAGGNWNLLSVDFSTPLTSKPKMNLTTLEKRWLKALLLDPRIQLFSPDENGLEDVEPLFTQEDIVYYDRNADGDPYTNENYICNFRKILRATRTGASVVISHA